MNIPSLMTFKSDVAFLLEDFSIRQAMEKMRFHGYTAVPVIDRAGKYIATLSEGDLLWYLNDVNENEGAVNTEMLFLKDILKKNKYKAVNINADENTLYSYVLEQNFVPVVDDRNMFIGIITRKAFLTAIKQ
ncbi:MAG: CBS domain-containing protein [Clostridia bacterium]|nr:CBS domain-containing protein [Clostridia bacterium]